eukprot:SAG22_NODE_188_length_15821_cov_38.313319_26_plen_143_part_00
MDVAADCRRPGQPHEVLVAGHGVDGLGREVDDVRHVQSPALGQQFRHLFDVLRHGSPSSQEGGSGGSDTGVQQDSLALVFAIGPISPVLARGIEGELLRGAAPALLRAQAPAALPCPAGAPRGAASSSESKRPKSLRPYSGA